jgi:hypothetical protein
MVQCRNYSTVSAIPARPACAGKQSLAPPMSCAGTWGGDAMRAPEQACDMQTLFCSTGFHQAFIIHSGAKTLFLSDIRIPFAFCWHGYC